VETLGDLGKFVRAQGPNSVLDLFNTHTASLHRL
jgi:hypothetical protein